MLTKRSGRMAGTSFKWPSNAWAGVSVENFRRVCTSVRFALNIPVSEMPQERTAFILRSVIRRSEDFLRYLMMLLSGYESNHFASGNSDSFAAFIRRSSGDLRLLENTVAALAADPAQLVAVDKLVLDLEEGLLLWIFFPPGFWSSGECSGRCLLLRSEIIFVS